LPKGFTLSDYQNHCLEKIEKRFSKNNDIAAFIMESGAQMAGGVIIYPKDFQKKIKELCKKYDILFVLDEIATGFGRSKKYSRHSSIWKNVNWRVSNNGSYTCK
jgi:adenosylmethionine-8-amino-7-oxononanoate aminotransferase